MKRDAIQYAEGLLVVWSGSDHGNDDSSAAAVDFARAQTVLLIEILKHLREIEPRNG